MAVVHYGDGTLYGQADAFYGRISADISAAQDTQVRETGLIVKIIDERSNRWETILADADQSPEAYKNTPGMNNRAASMTQNYWSYRGQAGVCILDNGTIVRVRVDVDDLNIYYQEITDPTNVAQWSSWTLLYTGPYYSVAIAPDVNTYIVYGSKSDGVYRNNVKQWTATEIMGIVVHCGVDGRQQKENLWIKRAQPGAYNADRLQVRKFDWYHTSNITTTTPQQVVWNYQWSRSDVTSILLANGTVARITSYPMYAPHAQNAGESMGAEIVASGSAMRTQLAGPRLIRGMPSEWGHNHVSGALITKLSDGYYYLFYKEIHVDNDYEFSSSPAIALVWQRSKDCLAWSEPVHTSHDEWALAGVVEKDGYAYLCGNGSVHRRPTTSTEYEITDFVPQVEWDSPRDNQTGSGKMVVANPEDVNSEILDLSDRRIVVQPGIKTAAGYEFVSLDDFWIRKVSRIMDGSINRLNVDFGNIWVRLENPLRDVHNFVGKTLYRDWYSDTQNEAFNYYFDSSDEPEVEDNGLIASGRVLWTAWKGMNPYFAVNFNKSPFSLYIRYEDEHNYLELSYNGSSVRLTEVSNKRVEAGEAVIIGTASASGVTRLGIRARWKYFDIYTNGTLLTTFTDETPILNRLGYVGWMHDGPYTVWAFDFEDLEYDYTSKELIRQALALGDYHDAIISNSDTRQYALMWGQQTDLATPADGLRSLLELEKLELIWRDGLIHVGQFKETAPYKIIEDRIIRTEHANEGNHRINLALVDGNDSTWLQVDLDDATARDRMINAYFDLPELETEEATRERALEEIRRSALSETPGGLVPLFFDLWRMDPIEWVDNAGNSRLVRIEGIQVTINQSTQPSQRQQLDTSLIENG